MVFRAALGALASHFCAVNWIGACSWIKVDQQVGKMVREGKGTACDDVCA